MGVTINISNGSGAIPSVSGANYTAGQTSSDAGTNPGCTAAAGQGGMGQGGMGQAGMPAQGPMGQAGMPGQRFDGGQPPPALVQEVEAALNRIGASAMASSAASDSMNGGTAPV